MSKINEQISYSIEAYKDFFDESALTDVDLAKIDSDVTAMTVTALMGDGRILHSNVNGPVLTIDSLTQALKKFHQDYPDEIQMEKRTCFGFPPDEDYERSPHIIRNGKTVLIKPPATFWIPPDTCRFEFAGHTVRKVVLREHRDELLADIGDELTTPAEAAFGFKLTGRRLKLHNQAITFLVYLRIKLSEPATDPFFSKLEATPITLKPMISRIPFTIHDLAGLQIVANPHVPHGHFVFLNGGF